MYSSFMYYLSPSMPFDFGYWRHTGFKNHHTLDSE